MMKIKLNILLFTVFIWLIHGPGLVQACSKKEEQYIKNISFVQLNPSTGWHKIVYNSEVVSVSSIKQSDTERKNVDTKRYKANTVKQSKKENDSSPSGRSTFCRFCNDFVDKCTIANHEDDCYANPNSLGYNEESEKYEYGYQEVMTHDILDSLLDENILE